MSSSPEPPSSTPPNSELKTSTQLQPSEPQLRSSESSPPAAPVSITPALLAQFQCPLQLTNSSSCWTSQLQYIIQQEVSSPTQEQPKNCPFGHQALQEEAPTTLTPLSPFLCLEYLQGQCQHRTFQVGDDQLMMLRCLHGFHPSVSQLANLEPYFYHISHFYKLDSLDTAPICTNCGRSIPHAICHYPKPSSCIHFFCISCISLWQPYAGHQCPRCTSMPTPRKCIRSRSAYPQNARPRSASGSLGFVRNCFSSLQPARSPQSAEEEDDNTPTKSYGRNLLGIRIETELSFGPWCCVLLTVFSCFVILFLVLCLAREKVMLSNDNDRANSTSSTVPPTTTEH